MAELGVRGIVKLQYRSGKTQLTTMAIYVRRMTLKIENCFYKRKDNRQTWTKQKFNLKTVIDYVVSKGNLSLQWNDVRVLRGIMYESDHYLVRAKVVFPFKQFHSKEENRTSQKLKISNETSKYNLDSFTKESTRYLFQQRLDQ